MRNVRRDARQRCVVDGRYDRRCVRAHTFQHDFIATSVARGDIVLLTHGCLGSKIVRCIELNRKCILRSLKMYRKRQLATFWPRHTLLTVPTKVGRRCCECNLSWILLRTPIPQRNKPLRHNASHVVQQTATVMGRPFSPVQCFKCGALHEVSPHITT